MTTPQVTQLHPPNANTGGPLLTFPPGPEAPLPHTTESEPLPLLPAVTDSTAISVDDRLREAASMIQAGKPTSVNHTLIISQVSGRQSDVLEQHRQRRGASNLPTQDRLRGFTNTIYPQPIQSAPSMSSFVSSPSASQISQQIPTDSGVYYVKRGKRDEKLEEVIKYAALALVNEMTLNGGWKRSNRQTAHARTVWKREISESVNQACIAVNFRMCSPSLRTILTLMDDF